MATAIYTGTAQAADWTNAANWQGGKVATATGTALLEGGPILTFAGPVSANNIMVLGGESVTFTGTVTTAGLGNCQGFMDCVGALTTFGPGATLNDGGVFQVGVHQVGTVVAQGTAGHATTLHTNSTTIGKFDAGNGSVTADDVTWSNAKSMVVGDAGQGQLLVDDGSHVTVGGSLALGVMAGSSGTVHLTSGATMGVAGWVTVGAAGTGAVTVDGGAALHVTGGISISAGDTVTLASGTVSASVAAISSGGSITGSGTLDGKVSDNGTLRASGGILTVTGNLGGGGLTQIGAGATLAIDGAMVNTASISFASTATLQLAAGAKVTAALTGFAAGDAITMAGVDQASWNASSGVLTLKDAGHAVDTLHLTGSFASGAFSVTQHDGVGVIALHA